MFLSYLRAFSARTPGEIKFAHGPFPRAWGDLRAPWVSFDTSLCHSSWPCVCVCVCVAAGTLLSGVNILIGSRERQRMSSRRVYLDSPHHSVCGCTTIYLPPTAPWPLVTRLIAVSSRPGFQLSLASTRKWRDIHRLILTFDVERTVLRRDDRFCLLAIFYLFNSRCYFVGEVVFILYKKYLNYLYERTITYE